MCTFFEAFNCWPLPWLLSSQMRRSWPATEILPQTANPSCWSSKVDSQVTATNPVDALPGHARTCLECLAHLLWHVPPMDHNVDGGSRAPKVHQKCQELRSSWFPQNLNSSIVCGLSFPSISHLQTVAFYIASWHSDVQSRQFQLDEATWGPQRPHGLKCCFAGRPKWNESMTKIDV